MPDTNHNKLDQGHHKKKQKPNLKKQQQQKQSQNQKKKHPNQRKYGKGNQGGSRNGSRQGNERNSTWKWVSGIHYMIKNCPMHDSKMLFILQILSTSKTTASLWTLMTPDGNDQEM